MSFSQSPGFIAPPPPDPGQTLNALTAMRNYQAQSAQAQAYQGAIDPATGAFDQNRYNQLLVQQGTRGTWGGGAAMQQAGNASAALGQGTQEQIRAQLMQLQNVNGMYTPLLQAASDPNSPNFRNVPVENAQAALDQAHQMGLVNDQYYAQGRAILARQAPGSNVYDLVNGLSYANQSAQTQLGSRLPAADWKNLGGAIVPTQGNPALPGYTGPLPGGQGYPLGLSPGETQQSSQWLNQPASWADPKTGAPRQGTVAQQLQAYGVQLPAFFPTPGGAGGGGAPASSVTTGRAPIATGTPGGVAPAAPGGVAPAPAQVPAVPAAPASPFGASAEQLPPATLQGGQQAYVADTTLARSLGSRISPLENALSVLRSNPDLATGPGQAEFASAMTGVTQSLGLPTPTQATSFQELSKYLTQYMRNLPGANRSDLASLEAQAASPNPEQSRDAMETLLAKAVGYERLQSAPLDWFNSQYQNPADAARNSGQYLLHSSTWAKTQDPVAYAVDEMTPEMYQSYTNGLSAAAKDRFKASRIEALKLYPWLRLGGGAASAPPQPAAGTQ